GVALFRLRAPLVGLKASASPRPTVSPRSLQKKPRWWRRHRTFSIPLFACRNAPEGTPMSGEAAACAAQAQKIQKIAAARKAWRARMRNPRWQAKNAEGGGYVPPHRCTAQARGAWSHLGRMRADDRLIDGRTPTGAGGEEKIALLDHLRLGEERGFLRRLADVDVHDAEVGDRGAEMRAHDIGERSVEIVRGDADLVSVGHGGHLRRLQEAVPLRVDDRDVDRVIFEVRLEIATAENRLQRADRGRRRLPDQAQRPGLAHGHFI